MKCANNHDNSDGASFCAYCGEELREFDQSGTELPNTDESGAPTTGTTKKRRLRWILLAATVVLIGLSATFGFAKLSERSARLAADEAQRAAEQARVERILRDAESICTRLGATNSSAVTAETVVDGLDNDQLEAFVTSVIPELTAVAAGDPDRMAIFGSVATHLDTFVEASETYRLALALLLTDAELIREDQWDAASAQFTQATDALDEELMKMSDECRRVHQTLSPTTPASS